MRADRRTGVEGFGEDPGAQPQRTALAWQRSALSVGLGGVVLAFTAERQGHPVLAAIAGIVAAAAVVLLATTTHTWRPGAAGPALTRYAVAVGAVAVTGAVVALAGLR